MERQTSGELIRFMRVNSLRESPRFLNFTAETWAKTAHVTLKIRDSQTKGTKINFLLKSKTKTKDKNKNKGSPADFLVNQCYLKSLHSQPQRFTPADAFDFDFDFAL